MSSVADVTEIGYFLGDLKTQVSHFKPTDRSSFAEKYFSKVLSCLHVIGMPYGAVTASNHNRRSLVHCLIQSFGGFAPDTQVTALDFFHLIEALSPQFPKALVLEVSGSVKVSQFGSYGSSANYSFEDISHGVYCSILFEDWLRLMRDYFVDEGVQGAPLGMRSSKLKEFHISISPSVSQPPLPLIFAVIEEVSAISQEISLEQFKQGLFASKALRAELARLALLPPTPAPIAAAPEAVDEESGKLSAEA
jgi:hypothetical protein